MRVCVRVCVRAYIRAVVPSPATAGPVSEKVDPPGSFKSGVIFDLRFSFLGCNQSYLSIP